VNNNILILTDYRGAFYSSTKNTKTLCTMNVEHITKYFIEMGYCVEVVEFSRVDFSKDFRGVNVLYTSSEDYGLFYRSYIEDVIFALKKLGANLLPDIMFLRAHHNKAFMECLRMTIFPEQKDLLIGVFGCYEELEKTKIPEGRYVVKKAYGAGSNGVLLANSKEKLMKIAKKVSKTPSFMAQLQEIRRRLLWGKGYHHTSLNCNKFIVQKFIEGLQGDFKVLKYGEKFYTLYRQNRKNDFRASGGGRLSFQLPAWVKEDDLLTEAKRIADRIDTPLLSIDIAYDGNCFYLVEFQCLNFGPYTAEHSDHYHTYEENRWIKHDGACDWKRFFVRL